MLQSLPKELIFYHVLPNLSLVEQRLFKIAIGQELLIVKYTLSVFTRYMSFIEGSGVSRVREVFSITLNRVPFRSLITNCIIYNYL